MLTGPLPLNPLGILTQSEVFTGMVWARKSLPLFRLTSTEMVLMHRKADLRKQPRGHGLSSWQQLWTSRAWASQSGLVNHERLLPKAQNVSLCNYGQVHGSGHERPSFSVILVVLWAYRVCCPSFLQLPEIPGIGAWAHHPLPTVLNRAWTLGNPCLLWGLPTRSGGRASRCSPVEGKPNSGHYDDDIVSRCIGPRIKGTYSPGCSISGLGQIMTVKFLSVGFLSKKRDTRRMSIVMFITYHVTPS